MSSSQYQSVQHVTHTHTREHTYSRLLDLICPLRLLPFCPFEILRYPIGDAVKVNFPLRRRFFKHKDHTRNFLYFTQNCFICAEPRSSCEGCSRRRVNDVFIKCSDVSLYKENRGFYQSAEIVFRQDLNSVSLVKIDPYVKLILT